MKKDILISVIVPIYNVEQYLKKCVKSIINQTYKNLEIILVNDGSTDNSRRICDKLAAVDQRIIVIHQKNSGLVLARKKGLEIARGEYVAFVDSDDWIEEKMYEELLDTIVFSQADFVHSDCYHEFEDGIEAQKIQYIGKNIYDERDEKFSILYDSLFARNKREKINPSIWSKLFKTEFAKKCYDKIPEEQCYGEDVIFLCECIINSKRIAVVHQSFYHYLIRQDSLAHYVDEEKIAQIVSLYQNLKKLFLCYGYYERLKRELRAWLIYHEIDHLQRISEHRIEISNFYFRNIEYVKDKKVIIYGAGKVGKDYYMQLSRYHKCTIQAWVDSNYKQYQNVYMEITNPENICNIDFDYVIIAVDSPVIADSIFQLLAKMNVQKNRILWERPAIFGEIM